ncbi:TIGR01841 family phasin [Paraburkholderia dipogonis]|uniref:TIGR01841 family phasin n=1 Tax=Paraburkholderia dipogonis TaxID=1211383 RepID=A0ABW9AN98_9BURK
MNLLTPEQVAAAQRANLGVLFSLTSQFVEGTGKLAALHLTAIRSSLAETREIAVKALSANGPQEWFALQAAIATPMAEKAQSYSSHVLEIVSATQAECLRIAQTSHEAYNGRVQALVEDAARNAPAGSEAAIAAWKSAIATTSTLIETLQKTGQQAVQLAESNFEAATAAASKAARRTIEQASAGAKR